MKWVIFWKTQISDQILWRLKWWRDTTITAPSRITIKSNVGVKYLSHSVSSCSGLMPWST